MSNHNITYLEEPIKISNINITAITESFIDCYLAAESDVYGSIILYQGDEYLNLGTWTNQDIIDRIILLYNKYNIYV